jgi:uncharacterized protein with PQ loop repeat
MDTVSGFEYSWSGFLDYTACFHTMKTIWIIVGAVVFVGTGISVLPQVVRLIRLGTAHGLSSTYVIICSTGQALVVLNIFCLHNADFYGILQIPLSRAIPRFLTFCTMFILWFAYLPLLYLITIFFDFKPPRPVGAPSPRDRHLQWRFTSILSCAIAFLQIALTIPFYAFGTTIGFASETVLRLGSIAGVVASAMTVFQYLPQFMTLCKLKDNGSLSLLMLAIQAPGGTVSTIFMCIGNSDNWSTWLSLGLSAVQQWFMLALCLFYKARVFVTKRRKAWSVSPFSHTTTSSSLLGSENYDQQVRGG